MPELLEVSVSLTVLARCMVTPVVWFCLQNVRLQIQSAAIDAIVLSVGTSKNVNVIRLY